MDSKVILITGASSGIGEAAAQKLASESHALMLAARSTDKLESIASSLGDSVRFVSCDVTQVDQVQAAVKHTLDSFGRLDVLVNNAGLGDIAPLAEGKIEMWDRMIDVNLKGALYAIHSVIPVFKEQQSGHIINVASVAGHHVFPNSVVYASTKHALRAISEGIRLELQDILRITNLSPGAVATNFSDSFTDPKRKAEFGQYLAGGLKPQNIANAISYVINEPESVVINELIIRPTRRS